MLTEYKCIDCGYMFKSDSKRWDGRGCPSSIHWGRLVPVDGYDDVEVPLYKGEIERWLASE